MQTGGCLGQKSNYINETHCEVLIYDRAESQTAVQSPVSIPFPGLTLVLDGRKGIGRKIYRSEQDAVKINTCKTVRKLKTLNNKRGRPLEANLFRAPLFINIC